VRRRIATGHPWGPSSFGPRERGKLMSRNACALAAIDHLDEVGMEMVTEPGGSMFDLRLKFPADDIAIWKHFRTRQSRSTSGNDDVRNETIGGFRLGTFENLFFRPGIREIARKMYWARVACVRFHI